MAPKYYLISKITNTSFTNYRGSARRLSERIPETVDEIFVGVYKKPKKIKKITTFKDKEGNIIERAFDYSDGRLRNRIYTYDNSKISADEQVKSITIRDLWINKKMLSFYDAFLKDYEESKPLKTVLWNFSKIITNHISNNPKTDTKILSQTVVSNYGTPTKMKHRFVEYPAIISNKIQKTQQKILQFLVNSQTSKIIPKSISSQNAAVPQKDSFLEFRALDVYDVREGLTKRFLKERKMNKGQDIQIDPFYYPQNEDEKIYSAMFDPNDGSINFNRFYKAKSKAEVVSTSRHETEHAWQYFLRARIAMPTTEWEAFINRNFCVPKTKKLIREAMKYYKSIRNYVSLTKELEQNKQLDKYRNNYIEKKAHSAGRKASKQYIKEGYEIRKEFSHIPEKFL